MLLGLGALWVVLVIALAGGSAPNGTPARWLLAGLAVVGLAGVRVRAGRWWASAACALAVLAAGSWFAALEPRTDRAWLPEQARQARAEFDGSLVRLRDLRRFRWRSAEAGEPGWFDAEFDVRELEAVDFLIARISSFEGVAHTMVSFRFAGDRFLVLSVEARKELGESYGVLRGALKQFELIYVLGDERDLVELRAVHAAEPLTLYPVRAPRERLADFFVDVCRRATQLADEPEFYDTLRRNCTTSLLRHWERVADEHVGLDLRAVLPGYSAELAAELGLFGDEDLATLTAKGAITARARDAAGRDDFSLAIRKP